MSKRILLIDADSKEGYANLALMKFSAFYKAKGYLVDLARGIPSTAPLFKYDHVIISCIFTVNEPAVRDYIEQLNNSDQPVMFGGSGFFPKFKVRLGEDLEHIRPDYDLYGYDYSIGFTSRGCKRNCDFCLVPKMEGKIKDHAPVSEFWDPKHEKIILLDNNFQASPKWKENMRFIHDHDLKVNFNQGLDIRILNDEFASVLAETKFYSWNFKTRSLHFAFDSMRVKKAVLKGVKILGDHGIKPYRIMFYVLVGFDTTIEQDLERIHILKDLGAYPYVMRYNKTSGNDKELLRLARWANRRYYQHIEWKDYKRV